MPNKSLESAINYVLGLHSPELLHKGENYAQFNCKVYGQFDIMFFYADNKWCAFKEIWSIGKDYPTIQTLFYFD